jgi:polysaccharide pyruvyl transferase WcaK-like protein
VAASPRILLATAAGYSNIGDDAIAAAVLARFSRELPQALFTIVGGPRLGNIPEAGQARHLGWEPFDLLAQAVRDAEAVVIGGGGLLYDSTFRADAADVFGSSSQWLIRVKRLAALAREQRRPMMLYAVGAGPLVSRAGRELARAIVEGAARVTVRDDYSRQALANCGAPPGRIHVAADPALETPVPSVEEARMEIGRWQVPRLPRPWIALNVRPWFRFQGLPLASRPKMDRLLASVERALQRIVEETGGSVVGLALQSGRDGDRRLLRRVLRTLVKRNHAAVVAPASPKSAQALVAQMDIAVGMRLHLHVFAANAQVPSVALAYDPKVECFMSDLGMQEFVLPVEGCTAGCIAEAAVRALRRREQLRERIRARRESMVRRCSTPGTTLKDMLLGTPAEPVRTEDLARGDPVGWETERAALAHYAESLERRAQAGFIRRAGEPILWAMEAVRRVTGRG